MLSHRRAWLWFYCSHLRLRRSQGFTLIELLVVVIILAILAAIALPSMLSQASKAREAEAKSDIGAVNRAQQAYRLANTTFSNDIANLEIGISPNPHYKYGITQADSNIAEFQAEPNRPELKALTGCARALTSFTLTSTEIIEVNPPSSGTATPATCP
ncbi:prepilin-type N-terminal cleavage/methylation domain-containing protein [Thermosynechococcaceae cyanobacterium Okahandja]